MDHQGGGGSDQGRDASQDEGFQVASLRSPQHAPAMTAAVAAPAWWPAAIHALLLLLEGAYLTTQLFDTDRPSAEVGRAAAAPIDAYRAAS